MEPTLNQNTVMLEIWYGRLLGGGAIGAIAPKIYESNFHHPWFCAIRWNNIHDL